MPKLLNQDQDEIFLPQKARDQDFQASLVLLCKEHVKINSHPQPKFGEKAPSLCYLWTLEFIQEPIPTTPLSRLLYWSINDFKWNASKNESDDKIDSMNNKNSNEQS